MAGAVVAMSLSPTDPTPIPIKARNDGAMLTNDKSGQAGVVVTTTTTAVTGVFTAIQILEDVVFTTLTETGKSGDNMTGFPIPAGVTLFGNFTAYTLASGKVRAYV